MPHTTTARTAQPAIDVRALSKLHGDVTALFDVTFGVHAGDIALVRGGAGAGKSTLLRLLAGHTMPSGGRIRIHGTDPRTARLDAGARVGYVPEGASRGGVMRPIDLMEFAGRSRALPRRLIDERIQAVSALCGLRGLLHERTDRLPRVLRVRVALAQALVHRPQVLLVDAPLAELTCEEARDVVSRLWSLRGALTTLVTAGAHDNVPLAPDRVLMLEQGRLVALLDRLPAAG
ncbi:MAG: ATP-binding cassette domain-containing protein [Vicinamibacterales bacterium]